MKVEDITHEKKLSTSRLFKEIGLEDNIASIVDNNHLLDGSISNSQEKNLENEDKQINNDEILKISIEYAPHEEEIITVHNGETAEEIADKFCKKHNLPEKYKGKLAILLKEKISEIHYEPNKKNKNPNKLFSESKL